MRSKLAFWFSMLAMASWGGLPAQAGDNLPDWSKPGRLCDSLKTVPLMKELREDRYGPEGQTGGLDQNISDMNNSLSDLATKCSAYRASPQQTGPLMDAMKGSLSDTQTKSTAFNTASAAVIEKEATLIRALAALGENDCESAVATDTAYLKHQKTAFALQANTACNSKQDRASSISGIGSKASMADDRAAAAILDPKANRADSAALLKQASDYAAAHGLPNPAVSATDSICGEACVSVLRMQSAEDQFGEGSWEYNFAAATAKNTKPALYGYSNQ